MIISGKVCEFGANGVSGIGARYPFTKDPSVRTTVRECSGTCMNLILFDSDPSVVFLLHYSIPSLF